MEKVFVIILICILCLCAESAKNLYCWNPETQTNAVYPPKAVKTKKYTPPKNQVYIIMCNAKIYEKNDTKLSVQRKLSNDFLKLYASRSTHVTFVGDAIPTFFVKTKNVNGLLWLMKHPLTKIIECDNGLIKQRQQKQKSKSSNIDIHTENTNIPVVKIQTQRSHGPETKSTDEKLFPQESLILWIIAGLGITIILIYVYLKIKYPQFHKIYLSTSCCNRKKEKQFCRENIKLSVLKQF